MKGLAKLNRYFGIERRTVKGKVVPPPQKVSDVLLATAEREAIKKHGRVRRPDAEPQEGWNRALRRANGDRGDRRHWNHPWQTRAIPKERA